MVRPAVIAALCAALVAGCGGPAPKTETPAAVKAAALPAVSPARARALGLTRELPERYRRVCAAQARYAPAGARVCPPLIPAGRLTVSFAAPFSKQQRYRGGYLADFASRSAALVESNGGHWNFGVSWTPAVSGLLIGRGVEHPGNASRASACRYLRLGPERVEACRVVPYEAGGGRNGGHVAYVWRRERVSYVVTVHGYRNDPRARAMMSALVADVLG